ncbi:heme-binding domain-containing protein [Flavilitoribacter nigricans]|uniref:Cytochrome C n=1 Tax=Flavilitoribacter nigricans (strain ATCC 23147 / DSM 23189 / NBRC 102662 / NCIMB 1420 / SS-2) TaxID=1122177 RepID=A0A2D0NGE1_FLAN2|nr:heme-binding domain-containing protein [Flavilitoribacter nigricans]PHN07555.1 cytochrome C [Flavilitoribacter nigricans DSM 23189 = NBRC 102662]
MSKKVKTILLGIIGLLLVIQLFQIDKTNPPVRTEEDFIQIKQPPTNVENTLRTACYDCHSHETAYPWYTSVAPISWWIRHHINEGREHLNFSTWAQYDAERQAHKLEECEEETREGEMPLDSYTWVHREAQLSDTQRQQLADWFASLR